MTISIGKTFEQRCVNRTLRYIRQPSVSSQNVGMDETIALLEEDLSSVGAKVQVFPTNDFPVIFASYDIGAEHTLLLHGLYDTVPASETGWMTHPFDPKVMHVDGFGECIVGRGAEDAKTAIAIAVTLLEAYQTKNQTPPINVRFVLEASETGSGGIEYFVNQHDELLRDVDGVYWLFPMCNSDGTPIVPLGLKGQLMGRLRCRGGEWGGPVNTDIHGMHVNWIASPAEELAAAIASLKDRNGHVIVQGYADDVVVTERQRELVRTLTEQLDPGSILASNSAIRFRQEDFQEALTAHCFESELTITGIRSGTVKEDGEHVIALPAEATANVSLRFLPGQDPTRVANVIRKHLRESGLEHVQLEVDTQYRGGATDCDHPLVQHYINALRHVGTEPQIWPVHSTGMPVGLFTEELKLPWIGGIPVVSGRKHAINEFAQVAGMTTAANTMVALFDGIGQ